MWAKTQDQPHPYIPMLLLLRRSLAEESLAESLLPLLKFTASRHFSDKSLVVSGGSSSFPGVSCAIPNLSAVGIDDNTSDPVSLSTPNNANDRGWL